eukprot:764902-Hanusia_phi.AAC.3
MPCGVQSLPEGICNHVRSGQVLKLHLLLLHQLSEVIMSGVFQPCLSYSLVDLCYESHVAGKKEQRIHVSRSPLPLPIDGRDASLRASSGKVRRRRLEAFSRLSPQEHFGGWCYTPRQEARTFEEAEHVCRAWGGHVFRYAGTCSCHLLVLISPPPASSRWMRWRWRCGSSDTLTSGSASGGCPRLVSDGRRGQHGSPADIQQAG